MLRGEFVPLYSRPAAGIVPAPTGTAEIDWQHATLTIRPRPACAHSTNMARSGILAEKIATKTAEDVAHLIAAPLFRVNFQD